MVDPSELISSEDTAALLDVKPNTLACWRMTKSGPDFYRIGRRCFYRRADIMAWVATQHNKPRGSKSPEAA